MDIFLPNFVYKTKQKKKEVNVPHKAAGLPTTTRPLSLRRGISGEFIELGGEESWELARPLVQEANIREEMGLNSVFQHGLVQGWPAEK